LVNAREDNTHYQKHTHTHTHTHTRARARARARRAGSHSCHVLYAADPG